jgi:Alanine-zipper, major outer membrane lipoprotein
MERIRKLNNTGPNKDSLASSFPILNMVIDSANESLNNSNQAKTSASNAVQAANEANAKSDDTQQQLDNIILENGQSDAEVVQARGSAPLLKDRLNNVDTQLAGNVKSIYSNPIDTRFVRRDSIDLVNVAIDSVDAATNVNMPLSPYGNSEYVHPQIINFPRKWNGYTYWMAITPYKDNSEAYENPCIYVSNDGKNWLTPPGVTNPLQPYPASGRHYSDPCWILDKNGYTLHLIYRENGTGINDRYWLQSSDDGRNWSQKEIIYQSSNSIVSPDVVYFNGKYFMYFIDITDSYKLKRVQSEDLKTWTNLNTCEILGTSKILWHFEVYQSAEGLMLIANDLQFNNIMIFKSSDGYGFSLSSENLLTRTVAGRGLYKPSIIFEETATDLILILYYNLMGDTSAGGVDWELKRVVKSLRKNRLSNKTFSAKLQYLNSNSTAVEGDVPTNNIVANYVTDEQLTHYTFRIDIGDVSSLPSTRLLVVTLPEATKSIQGYFTFPIEHYGSNSNVMNLYGIVDTATNRLFIRNQKFPNSTDMNMYTHKLQGITSIRGSVTYFNNK